MIVPRLAVREAEIGNLSNTDTVCNGLSKGVVDVRKQGDLTIPNTLVDHLAKVADNVAKWVKSESEKAPWQCSVQEYTCLIKFC